MLYKHILFPPTYLNRKKLSSQLEGKTILITGASSGIGERLAYQLADQRVHLILVARRVEKLREMKLIIEKGTAIVTVHGADLRNKKELEELLKLLQALPDGLDIIISNAGKSIRRSIFQSLDRFHDFTRTMAINYFAPVQLILSVIPILQKTQGQIINISTINTLLIPFPYWAAYQASKTAFDTWFRSVAPELNAKGISTSTIYLPLVRTPMILPTKAYRNMPAMSTKHVANLICKAMYTKRKIYRPWWLFFGQLASILLRGFTESVLGRIGRRGKL
ncbi:SDR family NAD(P)-dependent oxidoreductase [Pseudoneobacillus sp. C159]